MYVSCAPMLHSSFCFAIFLVQALLFNGCRFLLLHKNLSCRILVQVVQAFSCYTRGIPSCKLLLQAVQAFFSYTSSTLRADFCYYLCRLLVSYRSTPRALLGYNHLPFQLAIKSAVGRLYINAARHFYYCHGFKKNMQTRLIVFPVLQFSVTVDFFSGESWSKMPPSTIVTYGSITPSSFFRRVCYNLCFVVFVCAWACTHEYIWCKIPPSGPSRRNCLQRQKRSCRHLFLCYLDTPMRCLNVSSLLQGLLVDLDVIWISTSRAVTTVTQARPAQESISLNTHLE